MAQPKYNAGDTVIYKPKSDPDSVVVELVLGTFKERCTYYAVAKFHYDRGTKEFHFSEIESCQVHQFDKNKTERLERTNKYHALLELGATPEEAITNIPNLKAAIRRRFGGVEKEKRSLEFQLNKIKGMLDAARGFLEANTLLDQGVAYGAIEWEDVRIPKDAEEQEEMECPAAAVDGALEE